MRIPAELHMRIIQAIRIIAHHNPDLRASEVEQLVFGLCKEAYRAGIVEMQAPIKLWEDVKEDNHGPN